MKKIYYIANIRLPSPKAHGIQIMKMCEAFALEGLEVELIVPTRKNTINISEVFEYYDVDKKFKITRVISSDLLGSTRAFGRVCYLIDLLTFLFSLCFKRIEKGSIIYSRDPILLLPFFARGHLSFWAEIHDLRRKKLFFLDLLKRADGIVAITNSLKERLAESGIPENKIIVAPDGVDNGIFNVTITKEESREKLGLTEDKQIAMYVDLFDDWKGYHTLLEASLSLPKHIQVAMIGGSPEQVMGLKVQYPHVRFLGFKPYKELSRHQRAADILVIPNSGKTDISRYFTSPLKLFAHMVSGRPIVASDLPSIREVLDDSMAYFFEPDSPESLASTIEQVLTDTEADKKAQKSFSHVREYTWEKRARKIIDKIKNLGKNI